MTDQQRCQQAATAPACPEKGAALQLTPHHLELIRAAQLALYRATAQHDSAAARDAALTAWQDAAERLAVALVSRLEALEVRPCP
ncbi:hypothetical protein [Geopseudomonas aromaticivorans]